MSMQIYGNFCGKVGQCFTGKLTLTASPIPVSTDGMLPVKGRTAFCIAVDNGTAYVGNKFDLAKDSTLGVAIAAGTALIVPVNNEGGGGVLYMTGPATVTITEFTA